MAGRILILSDAQMRLMMDALAAAAANKPACLSRNRREGAGRMVRWLEDYAPRVDPEKTTLSDVMRALRMAGG